MQRPILFKITIAAIFCLAPWCTAADEPSIKPPQAVLHWQNDDHLPGTILSANRNQLLWRTNLFVEPLQIRRETLRAIDWHYDQPSQLARSLYRLTTTDDNLLVGEILMMDQESVRMKNASVGEVVVERSKIRSIVNLATTQGRLRGPLWLEDWDGTVESKRSFLNNAQGQLTTLTNRNPLFKKISFAPNTVIDVAFKWQGKLDLKFAFAVPKKWGKLIAQPEKENNPSESDKAADMVVVSKDLSILDEMPRLEMFGDSLVLQQKELFDIILEQVDLDTGYLRLLFHWNAPAHQLQAYDTSGKLLATIKIETLSEDFEPGIVILNQGDNLTIDHLVILSAPKEVESNQNDLHQVLTATQQFISCKQGTFVGNIESFDGTNWSIRRTTDNTLVKVAAQEFYLVHSTFQSDTQAGSSGDLVKKIRETTIVLRDGTRLNGEFMAISEDSLRLQSSLGSQPLAIRMDHAERLDFPKTAWQDEQEETQVLETAKGRCRGRLTSDPAKPSIMQWTAIGSEDRYTLAKGDFQIQRNASKHSSSNLSKLYRDRLFLRNGDDFPANILRLQSGELLVEAFHQRVSIPADEVLRCLFDVLPPSANLPLESPPWKITTQEDQPQNLPDILASQPKGNARFAFHPNLLETGGFTLSVPCTVNNSTSRGDGSFSNRRIEIAMFVEKATDVGTKLYLSIIPMKGDTFFVSVDSKNGEFVPDVKHPMTFKLKDIVQCKVQLLDSEIIASINDFEVLRKRVKLGPDTPRGVSLKLDDQLPIESVRQERGCGFGNSCIPPETRDLCLTQPRFVANQSLRGILVGRNGDVWRADIVSLDDKSLMVRTGGRHVTVDRQLISSLVWPEKASETSPVSEVSKRDATEVANGSDSTADTKAKIESLTSVQLLMNDGMKMTLKLERWDHGQFVGSSLHFGRIELPVQEISELRSGNNIFTAADFEGQRWKFKLGNDVKLPAKGNGSKNGPKPEGEEMALVGQEAPAFSVKSLDDGSIDLAKFRGKVVVLDFWATWCGYCVAELPEMVDQIGKLSADKVQLVTLNQNEDAATIAAFMKKKKLDFLVGLDSDEVGPQYKVSGLPTTFVIDPEGKVAHVKVGGGDAAFEEMMQVVRKLVGENDAPATAPTDSQKIASKPSMKPDPMPGSSASEKTDADKGSLVSVESFIQPARGNQPALLVIQAKIAADHKVFSLTQPTGGPVKTKIKVDKSDSFTQGEFRAMHEPKRYPDENFGNMEVEVHQGVVTWFAPLDLAASVAMESLEIKGNVNMQLCNKANCFPPRNFPFTAKIKSSPTDEGLIDLSKTDRAGEEK